jgi:NAD(P)-dependent dehydrogenase (short-subunit alcohol dehydrogenase family)
VAPALSRLRNGERAHASNWTDASDDLAKREGRRGRRHVMDLGLTGKRAFVSGSTAGIGLAIASTLAAEGAHVTINGRTQKRVDEAIAKLRATHPGATVDGVAADLGSAEGVKQLESKLPEVDVLVNNLGIFEPKAFLEIPDDDWKRFFDVNVLSGIRLARMYLPKMLAKNWGRIVFISSESAIQIPAEMIHYGMTKTAQIAVARGIAESVAGTGVTVNSVLPGPTASEGVGGFVADLARAQNKPESAVEADFFREMRPSSLLRRFASVEEVGSLVAYVCSERASATTGAALRVDGGVIRAIA